MTDKLRDAAADDDEGCPLCGETRPHEHPFTTVFTDALAEPTPEPRKLDAVCPGCGKPCRRPTCYDYPTCVATETPEAEKVLRTLWCWHAVRNKFGADTKHDAKDVRTLTDYANTRERDVLERLLLLDESDAQKHFWEVLAQDWTCRQGALGALSTAFFEVLYAERRNVLERVRGLVGKLRHRADCDDASGVWVADELLAAIDNPQKETK